MARIAFMGLGHMGLPMAQNLQRAGHHLWGYDISEQRLAAAAGGGVPVAVGVAEALVDADVVITMVGGARDVKSLYLDRSLINLAKPGTLLIDCTSIDPSTASELATAAEALGHDIIDAPVSGGAIGAAAGKLCFMVGGGEAVVERASPILRAMGNVIVHVGPHGAGVMAKICNNLITGVSLVAVSEAFALAERAGIDPHRFYEAASHSSAQCWALTTLCPVAGPVPSSPANFEYRPGGEATLLVKDLGMACGEARKLGSPLPMGALALTLYEQLCRRGLGHLDCSAIIKLFTDASHVQP